MPRLKTENDVAEWLRGLFGKPNVVYRYESLRPDKKYWNRSNPAEFDSIIYFRPANYTPGTSKGRKRLMEDGPYVWDLLLANKEDYFLVTVNDGRHHGSHGYAMSTISRFDERDARDFLVGEMHRILIGVMSSKSKSI